MDKRTKRETQNYDRDEQESVRVEEQCIVQITISMIGDTYITFLFMSIQCQYQVICYHLDNKWHTFE
jgi:hypothetical protein